MKKFIKAYGLFTGIIFILSAIGLLFMSEFIQAFVNLLIGLALTYRCLSNEKRETVKLFFKKYTRKTESLTLDEFATKKSMHFATSSNIEHSEKTKNQNMYLFFDTETTGLPDNWHEPASNYNNWPRMVQLACLLYNDKGQLVESKDYIIKPDGYGIPSEAARIHGITTQKALSNGIDIEVVLTEFESLLNKATQLVAHNMEFDENIIGAEFYRLKNKNPLTHKSKFCTMKDPNIISHCAIPPIRYGSYKWPKLSELHYKLFGTDFDEAHNASVDIQITAKCFFALLNRGVI